MSDEQTYLLTFALVILMKIVCFILGYLTVRLGHQLIAAGVKGEFHFFAEVSGAKADLASVSPGLLFVLLGVCLIGYAIHVEKGADYKRTTERTTSTDAPPKGPVPTSTLLHNDPTKKERLDKGDTRP